jgi:hypothetical protein
MIPQFVKDRVQDVLTAIADENPAGSILNVSEEPDEVAVWSFSGQRLWRMWAQAVSAEDLHPSMAEAVDWKEEWDQSVADDVVDAAKALTDARHPRRLR